MAHDPTAAAINKPNESTGWDVAALHFGDEHVLSRERIHAKPMDFVPVAKTSAWFTDHARPGSAPGLLHQHVEYSTARASEAST
jgi:hypothetical protein